MTVRVRRRGSYRLEFWVSQYREPRVLRAIAQTGNLTTASNEATVMTPTRLEPSYFEFVLPKTRVVQEVRVNGRAQSKRACLSVAAIMCSGRQARACWRCGWYDRSLTTR